MCLWSRPCLFYFFVKSKWSIISSRISRMFYYLFISNKLFVAVVACCTIAGEINFFILPDFLLNSQVWDHKNLLLFCNLFLVIECIICYICVIDKLTVLLLSFSRVPVGNSKRNFQTGHESTGSIQTYPSDDTKKPSFPKIRHLLSTLSFHALRLLL